MARWRCHNDGCGEPGRGLDFDGDEPVCPNCGVDLRKPEGRNVVIRLQDVHLLVRRADGPIIGRGKRLAALCQPAAQLRGLNATGEPSSATCPACKAHPEFPKEFDEMTPALVPPSLQAMGGTQTFGK